MENKKIIPRLPISKIAEKVYGFLVAYYSEHGYMPTQGEISTYFTNPQTGEIYTKQWSGYCLKELEKQGRIKLENGKHRGIVLL